MPGRDRSGALAQSRRGGSAGRVIDLHRFAHTVRIARARRLTTFVVLVLSSLVWGAVPGRAVLDAAACSTTTALYTVQVCLTAPAPAATLNGTAPVSATAT